MSEKPKQPSRVVFIGNISFDIPEEQLIEIFKEVGPITNFRLMIDKDTGKPRGFAFCEYADIDTAGSAIRNLNGFEINGRSIKVDYADSEMPMAGAATHSLLQPQQPSVHSAIPAMPGTSVEAINATLAAMSNQQLIDLIGQAKALAIANPEQARALLSAQPQLTFALFQAMLLTNLVEPRVVQQIMHSLPKSSAPSQSVPPPPQPQQQSRPVDKDEVIKQVMSLTEEQIAALPPDSAAQVRVFRAQFGSR